MAENDPPKQLEDEDEAPLVVPSHDPLPPPPEVHYTRPIGGQTSSSPTPFRGAVHPGDEHQEEISTSSSALKLGSGLAAGTTFVASVIAGFLIGQWVDHRWNHAGGMPWGTLIFALLGVAAGFVNLFRVLSATDRSRKQ